MTGYIAILPFLLYIINWLIPKIPYPHKFVKIYTIFLIIICAVLTVADFNIYREWGTKLNYRAFQYAFNSPKESIASGSSIPFFATFSFLIILLIAGYFLAKKLIFTQKSNTERTSLFLKFPISLLALAFTFLAIRGTWTIAPMNPSMVYFSDKPILNHASLNTEWMLIKNIIRNAGIESNPYQFMDHKKAGQIVSGIYKEPTTGTTALILNNKKPNIVIIIMESFTAQVVKELGGENNITPNFSKLIKEGLLFNNIYANGDRTDKGIIAILSAFPAQAIRSIITEGLRQEKLTSIMDVLDAKAYHTSFFYGGNLEFSNFRSYLLSHKTHKIYDNHDLNSNDIQSYWGAADEVIFKKQSDFLNTEKQPFLATLLTLSNHTPYTIPARKHFGADSDPNQFRSTSFYTDSALYTYVNEAKKQTWYKNTLFVVVADHGHPLPGQLQVDDPKRYHIPLLMFGGALKTGFAGKVIDKYGSQTDIAFTLLKQLGINQNPFKYSNNLLNPAKNGFGFYNWDNGFGCVSNKQTLSYDPISKRITYQKNKNITEPENKELLDKGKAMMQSVFQDLLNY